MEELLSSFKDAYSEALIELGKLRPEMVVLDADCGSGTGALRFQRFFPERFIHVGIAEQNMIGVAAGLATIGFIPFTNTMAVFASRRCLDQVYISIAYPHLNVRLIGAYCGFYVGKGGATHQAINDISVMRTIPNMVIINPADGIELKKVLFDTINYNGPIYIRFSHDPSPVIFTENYKFQLGRSVTLCEGNDATIVSTGIMTALSMEATDKLKKRGLKIRVIHMPTIKPLDEEAVIRAAKETGCIVTVENHSYIGGLGSAVTETVCSKYPCQVQRVGIRDVFGESGSNEDLAKKYRLRSENIIQAVLLGLGIK